jgi:hypothetical protein
VSDFITVPYTANGSFWPKADVHLAVYSMECTLSCAGGRNDDRSANIS